MSDKIQIIEETYGTDIETILRRHYWDQDCTQAETADAIETTLANAHGDGMDPDPPIDLPRSTISTWFREYGISSRSRELTDLQRVAILAGFTFGVGNVAIANRLGVGKSTVKRYREQVVEMGEGDFEQELRGEDAEFVERVLQKARRRTHGHSETE